MSDGSNKSDEYKKSDKVIPIWIKHGHPSEQAYLIQMDKDRILRGQLFSN